MNAHYASGKAAVVGLTKTLAAGGIFLLCSPWSNFITGQVLTVSGVRWEG